MYVSNVYSPTPSPFVFHIANMSPCVNQQRASLWGMLASILVGSQHCASLWGILAWLGPPTSVVDTAVIQ